MKAEKKFNFTKKALESLSVDPDGGRITVYDTSAAGLGVTVFPTGARSFFHLRVVRGKVRRSTIGQFPETTVEQARGEASERNATLARWKFGGMQGEDPFEDRPDPTLDDVTTQYIDRHVKARASRPERAAKTVKWTLEKYLAAWRKRKIGSIRKPSVGELHRRLAQEHGKYTANRVLQFLKALFYWAIKEEIWHGVNPAVGIELFDEVKRRRFLQPEELPQFFAALRQETNSDLRDFVNLAMWTGARRGDIFSMRWQDVSIADNRWQIPDPKNGEPYSVALTPEAIEILKDRIKRAKKESPWAFPSRGKTGHVVDLKAAWRKLLVKANLGDADLRIHDLRRTLGSWQAAQGTSLNIIGGSLGHKSLEATRVYAQLDLDPVRSSVMSATRTMIAASKKRPKQLPSGVKPKQRKSAHG
jgi:integrase